MARRRPTDNRPPDPQPPASPPPAPSRARSTRLDAVPAWLQAVAALIGVLLTALVIFGLVRDPDAPTGAAQTPVTGRVTLEAVVTGADGVRAEGSYENLAVTRQTILFIGQPRGDEDATWLPVPASLFPEGDQPPEQQSGRWEATRPGVSGTYVWYAVIAPAVPGAGDQLADLRANGPESEFVLGVSESKTTD